MNERSECLSMDESGYLFVQFFFRVEDGIQAAQESRGFGDVYTRQKMGTI